MVRAVRLSATVRVGIGAAELARLHEMLDRYVPLFRPAAAGEGDNE